MVDRRRDEMHAPPRGQALAAPRITCILIARARPELIAQALRFYSAQTHPSRELVIVYEDASRDLPDWGLSRPPERDIRWLQARGTTDEKLTQARALAMGEFITRWPLGVWLAPQWLSRQIGAIEASGADACALDEVYVYDAPHQRAFKRLYRDAGEVAQGSLCWRRECWPLPKAKDVWRHAHRTLFICHDELDEDATITSRVPRAALTPPFLKALMRAQEDSP